LEVSIRLTQDAFIAPLVIPAEAGIQRKPMALDSCFRRNGMDIERLGALVLHESVNCDSRFIT